MDEELKKLLEENLKLTKEIHTMTKGIKSFVLWQRIFGVLKLLIIVVPIVLGIIYLPSLIESIQQRYQEILGIEGVGGAGNIFDILKSGISEQGLKDIDIDKLPPEAKKYLK